MELIYYRSEIKKITAEYDSKVQKSNKLANMVLIIVILLTFISILLSLVFHNYYLLIIIGFLFFLYGIFYIIKYYLLKSTFYKYMQQIQEKIFNGEGKYQLHVLEKIKIMELLREVRFSEKYDYLLVNEGYQVLTDDYEGYYLNVYISRSAGKSSMVVINGEVYILKMKSLYNYQLRNDYIRVSKLNKYKFHNYNVFADREIREVDDDGFFCIKRMFPESKHVGIDYSSNYIASFNNIRFKNPTSFQFNDQNVKIHYTRLLQKFSNLDKLYQELSKDGF